MAPLVLTGGTDDHEPPVVTVSPSSRTGDVFDLVIRAIDQNPVEVVGIGASAGNQPIRFHIQGPGVVTQLDAATWEIRYDDLTIDTPNLTGPIEFDITIRDRIGYQIHVYPIVTYAG